MTNDEEMMEEEKSLDEAAGNQDNEEDDSTIFQSVLRLIDSAKQNILKDPLTHVEKNSLATSLAALPAAKNGEVDLLNPGMASVIESRNLSAGKATTVTGAKALPLTQVEINNVSSSLVNKQPEDKLQNFAVLSRFGEGTTRAVTNKLFEQDPVSAIALFNHQEQGNLSLQILQGNEKLKNVKVGPKDQEQIDQTSREVFRGIEGIPEELQQGFSKAGQALNMFSGGGNSTLRKSIEKVAGVAEVSSFGGKYKTLVPKPGMTANDFQVVIDNLQPQDFTVFGNGTPVYAEGIPYLDQEDLDDEDSISEWRYIPVAQGRYRVKHGDHFVRLGEDLSKFYEIDLARLVKQRGR